MVKKSVSILFERDNLELLTREAKMRDISRTNLIKNIVFENLKKLEVAEA